jgi:hypothetical protein
MVHVSTTCGSPLSRNWDAECARDHGRADPSISRNLLGRELLPRRKPIFGTLGWRLRICGGPGLAHDHALQDSGIAPMPSLSQVAALRARINAIWSPSIAGNGVCDFLPAEFAQPAVISREVCQFGEWSAGDGHCDPPRAAASVAAATRASCLSSLLRASFLLFGHMP